VVKDCNKIKNILVAMAGIHENCSRNASFTKFIGEVLIWNGNAILTGEKT
jgi:hypothetical protein